MNHTSNPLRFTFALSVAAMLLVALFGLAMSSALEKSPTFDEGQYIGRGWLYMAGTNIERWQQLGHPPLTSELIGLGVLLEPNLPEPARLNGWAQGNLELVSEDLLWHQGLDADRIIFLSRIPILFLSLLLGVIIWRWAREMYGLWSATVALVLVAFSPTVIANAQLATTDMGIAVFYVATLYAWSRFLHRRTMRWLVISGIAFGLAQASKFSALVLIPTLGLMTLWFAWRRGALTLRTGGSLAAHFNRLAVGRWGWLRTAVGTLLLMGLIGLLVVWGCDRFTLRPLAPGHYFGELRHFLSLAAEGHRAYLLGQFSQSGWWYYHPFTLLVKLTLPELVLLVGATATAAARDINKTEWEILFPALAYLGVSMTGSLNVGIRYLLPIVPLFFLFAARRGLVTARPGWLRYVLSGGIVIWQVSTSLFAYPDYLAFFNVATGGPDYGYHLLADSNLDWGQDLPGLAQYLKRHDISQVYLSYFGHDDPAYYGINAINLPGWPPDQGGPTFYPMNPQPGIYAISASNLAGVQLLDQDTFGYFRAREPIANIGHSILIYQVPPRDDSAPTWVGQCAVPAPVENTETLRARAGVPDLRHFYFDCQRSLPIPSGPGWLVLAPDAHPIVDLGAPDYLARYEDGSPRYQAWWIDEAPPAPASKIDFPAAPLPVPIAGYLDLLGYVVTPAEASAGQTLTLTAWWKVREPPPPPVSIFAHLIAADGTVVQTGDALGIQAEDWTPGMVLIQQHTLTIDNSIPLGDYTLSVGLYSLSTGERFTISQTGDRVVDRIALRTIRIVQAGQ
jgi:hypothetical protein